MQAVKEILKHLDIWVPDFWYVEEGFWGIFLEPSQTHANITPQIGWL